MKGNFFSSLIPHPSSFLLRLAKYFRTTPEFWLKLQMDYDLALAREALAETLEREINSCAPPIRRGYD